MKRTILNSVLILITLGLSWSLSAQIKEAGGIVIPSVQTWNFMKYGGHQPNLYTGTVNVSIPIYTYKDQDFELPTSIDYASNGYMPNILAGMTGLGWRLNCGGVITREIRGIPDEKQIQGFSKTFYRQLQSISGYQHLINSPQKNVYITQSGVHFSAYTQGDSSFTPPSDFAIYNPHDTNAYETEPDVYTFNFMGYSGQFMFDLNGNACVFESNIPKGQIKIEINTAQISCPIFTVTTGDGYEYTFGSGSMGGIYYENMAYEYKSKSIDSGDGDSPDYPIAYYITKIKAPNGRTIDFTYGEGGIYAFPCLPTELFAMGAIVSINTGVWVPGATYNLLTNILQKIKIDDFEIDFTHGVKEKREQYLDNIPDAHGNRTLDAITFKYNTGSSVSKILKKCEFNYKYAQRENYVMLLDNIHIPGEGTYRMSYYNDEYFPYLGHRAVDHWRYWRGGYSPRYPVEMIPGGAEANTYTWPIPNDSRSPVFPFALSGMLQ